MTQFKKCEKGIWLVNHSSGVVWSPPCGLKSCPECNKRMRREAVHRILKQMSETQHTHKWWFWTITPSPESIWNETSQKNLQRGWERLRKRLMRRWHGEVYWVLTKEYTKGKGEFAKGDRQPPPFVHAHIIIAHAIGEDEIYTRELKDLCHKLGLGYMALVGVKGKRNKPITGKKEAYYQAKYIGKDETENGLPRTNAWSRNFKLLRAETSATSTEWELLRVGDDGIEDFCEDNGFSVRNGVMNKTT